ncbi:MAG: NHLP family bacteriocin export ABC transporter peptidase/permease/ATPase subunit [Crocosphaera sp.]
MRVKTKPFLQREGTDCGAACLGIILTYYGRNITLMELRRHCGISRDGTNAGKIIKTARKYGLDATGGKASIEYLKTIQFPAIIFWNFNHFVVLEGFDAGSAYINDPASGRRKVSLCEFYQSYTGIVLEMQPSENFTTGGETKNLIKYLAARLQNAQITLIFIFLSGFFLSLIRLAIPAFSLIFVDEILIENNHDWLRPLLLGMAITIILQFIIAKVQFNYLRKLIIRLSISMNSKFIWHTLRLPMKFYTQRLAGDISDRTSLNDEVVELLSQVANTLIDTVMLILYAILMSFYDWVLTLITIGFTLINVIALHLLRQFRIQANLKLSQEKGKLSGFILGSIQGIETVKAGGFESFLFARIAGIYAQVVNSQQKLALQTQILNALPVLLTALTTSLVLILGGFRVMEGMMTIGMLVAFQSLVSTFLKPINQLVNFASTLQELEANLERLDDILDHPIDQELKIRKSSQTSDKKYHEDLNKNKIELSNLQLTGKLELRKITFSYNPLKSPLIENFNLTLNPGQRIALIGKTGSGKSTIAHLICGLYQPLSGEILLDGNPRLSIPRSILAKSIAMVEQDIFLFAGTIRDNLTLWNPTISDADLMQACKDANIHNFIETLPGGYDSILLEGGINLSGGQKQRLEIARALVNNPRILVLDEATSSLDAETERIIDINLRRRGCACIVVAHRLSTIRDCDEIIVLNHGKVLERGTHQQLWYQGNFYRQLLQVDEGKIIDESFKRQVIQTIYKCEQNNSHDNNSTNLKSLINIPEESEVTQLEGNQTLLLDQKHIVWLVKSGTVEIFYSLEKQGKFIGNRHYLFTINEGDLIFNSDTLSNNNNNNKFQGKLLGLTFSQAELIKINLEHLTVDLSLSKQWIIKIQKAVNKYAQEIQSDNSSLMQIKLKLNQFKDKNKILYWQEITTINNEVCRYLAKVIEEKYNQEIIDSEKLNNYNQQMMTNTINDFVSVLTNQSHEQQCNASNQFTEQLLMVMGVIGRASGLKIIAPSLDHNQYFNQSKLEKKLSSNSSENLTLNFDSVDEQSYVNSFQPPKIHLAYLEEIAKTSQFSLRKVNLKGKWWKKENGPLLTWIKSENTPIALLPNEKHKYLIFNSQTQTYTPINSRIASHLSTSAIMFYRPFPEIINNAIDVFLFSIKGYQNDLGKIIVLGMAATLLGMITPQATAILVNHAIPDSDQSLLWQLGGGLMAVAFGKSIFQLAQGIVSLRVETATESSLQPAIFNRLFKLSPSFFSQFSTGDLLTRILAISQIRSLVGGATRRTLLNGFFSLLNLGLMLIYSQKLAVIALIISCITMIITIITGVILVRLERKQEQLSGEIQGFTVQLINGVQKLRIAAAEERSFSAWGKKYRPHIKLVKNIQQVNDIVSLIGEILPLVTSILIFWFTIKEIMTATLTGTSGLNMGTFLAFNTAMGSYLGGVTSLSNTVTDILGIIPLWERAKPIIQSPLEISSYQAHPGELTGNLALDNVSFSYQKHNFYDHNKVLNQSVNIHEEKWKNCQNSALSKNVLNQINLEVKSGEFIAIVGPSGSGKSTLFRLLLGFEKPSQGNILYDGKNLAELDLQSLRQQLGVVLQNGKVVYGSIYNNISCGGLVSPEMAWYAARQAGIDEDIEQMPMGMNTIVSETGNNLSVGQRQRLLIARALIHQPKILLFDEATSALDNHTQALVTDSLEKLKVTRIVIAHRLSTIRNADRIYVFSQGKIVQRGTFSELLKQEGLFNRLVSRQLV